MYLEVKKFTYASIPQHISNSKWECRSFVIVVVWDSFFFIISTKYVPCEQFKRLRFYSVVLFFKVVKLLSHFRILCRIFLKQKRYAFICLPTLRETHFDWLNHQQIVLPCRFVGPPSRLSVWLFLRTIILVLFDL